MHGVLTTFDCAASLDELAAPFGDDATALPSQPGLVSKAWISTDTGDGGFDVFTDRAAADRGIFDDVRVTHFDVPDDLSAMNGVHPVPA